MTRAENQDRSPSNQDKDTSLKILLLLLLSVLLRLLPVAALSCEYFNQSFCFKCQSFIEGSCEVR